MIRDQSTGRYGVTHGGSKTWLYRIWRSLHVRCYNTHGKDFAAYGGRGIFVAAIWHTFPAFETWAITNGYTKGHQLDRRENNGPYSPENCRVVTSKINMNNRRDNRRVVIFGEEKTIAEWAADARCRVREQTRYRRIVGGHHRQIWVPEIALTTPMRPGRWPASIR